MSKYGVQIPGKAPYLDTSRSAFILNYSRPTTIFFKVAYNKTFNS